MRYLIPLRQIMLDVSIVFGMKFDYCNTYTTTFEDNKGSIELEKEPKYGPQKIYISIKWHHFIENFRQGTSKMVCIEANQQQADIIQNHELKQNLSICANRS